MEPGQVPSMDSDSLCFSSTTPDSTNQGMSLSEHHLDSSQMEPGRREEQYKWPSPGKDNKRRPASPRSFLGSIEIVSVRILCLPWAPTQPSHPVAASTPCQPQSQLPKPAHCTEKGLSPGRSNDFPKQQQWGAGSSSGPTWHVALKQRGKGYRLQEPASDSSGVSLIHKVGGVGGGESLRR